MSGKGFWPAITGMVLLVAGAISLGGFAPVARATEIGLSVDVGFFYDRLAPYGDWQEHDRYGWVWCPRDLPLDWRPYTLGRWVYTDDYGWLWDSDEQWGWACFHYGRWDWDDRLGWFWVPGYDWGPAWVAWRSGPQFVGWCALPPLVGWRPGVGLELHGLELGDLPARRWVFVPVQFLVAPRLPEYVVLVSRNVTILSGTRNATRFRSIDGRIVDLSISVTRIEEATHRRVPRWRVVHVETAGALRLPHERDGVIQVFSPQVRRGPAGLVPPRPGEFQRREEAQRAQMRERQEAETARQRQQHQAERTAPHVRPEQLRSRQQAEEQALRAEHERQQQQLENRQRFQRQEFPPPEGGFRARGGGAVGRAR